MQAFRGGFESLESSALKWSDNVSATFKAALVGAINTTPDPDWQYITDFTNENPLIGDALIADVTTRVVQSWDAPNDQVVFQWNGQLLFGAPTAGQVINGVVIYEDTGDVFTSPLWFFDDGGTGFPATTQGGQVTYGGSSLNNAGALRAVSGGATPLRGAANDFRDGLSTWAGTGAVFRLMLVVDSGTTVPDPDWATLQDVIDGGVVFAAGAGSVAINQPSRGSGYEVLSSNSNSYEFWADPPAAFTFAGVPAGQTIVAVLLYRDTGNASTAPVWSWDGAFQPAAATGGDFVYGTGAQECITRVYHPQG